MSLARSCGVVINGIDGLIVDIEAYLAQGLPGMTIVGLGDAAVGESRDRVRAAIQNSGLPWPSERRITIGLSPASVRKNGASLDLGIAASKPNTWSVSCGCRCCESEHNNAFSPAFPSQ